MTLCRLTEGIISQVYCYKTEVQIQLLAGMHSFSLIILWERAVFVLQGHQQEYSIVMSTGVSVCCTRRELDLEGPHGDSGSAEKSLEQGTKIQDPSEKGPLRISNVCQIVVVE
jgi:hypothetical protein